MSTEIHPPLGADADAAPHDTYCAKLMAKVPAADLPANIGCLCSTFAMIRADELLQIDKAIADLPEAERGSARKVVTARLLPLLMTALMPSGGK